MLTEDWVRMGPDDPGRRYRQVSIDVTFWADILGNGTRQSDPAEPVPDLRVVGFRASSWTRTVTLLVQSASFEPVHPSMWPPEWVPSFTARLNPVEA